MWTLLWWMQWHCFLLSFVHCHMYAYSLHPVCTPELHCMHRFSPNTGASEICCGTWDFRLDFAVYMQWQFYIHICPCTWNNLMLHTCALSWSLLLLSFCVVALHLPSLCVSSHTSIWSCCFQMHWAVEYVAFLFMCCLYDSCSYPCTCSFDDETCWLKFAGALELARQCTRVYLYMCVLQPLRKI